jgi:hypothetical protein
VKVENPRFMSDGAVDCDDCPCCEETVPALAATGICCSFRGSDGKKCPTAKTYAEACALADKVAKEAQSE